MEGRGRGGEESMMMESKYDDTAHGKQADCLRMSTYGCVNACNPAASWVVE